MKIAYFQLALSMAFVGANVAVGKIIVEDVPIFLFSEIRFLIALLFLVPMMLISRPKTVKMQKSHWGYLILQSFFGVFLFSVLMLYGVRFTSATAAGIITSTVPAVIALLSFFFLRERLSAPQAISMCLAVLGISIITFQTNSSTLESPLFLLGNVLVFGAVISEALFTIFAKKLSNVLTPIQMAAGVNIIGFILFLPFSIKEAITYHFFSLELTVYLLIIYYAITASVLSFVLWYKGVVKVSANIAGIFTGFIPITATLVGIVILKEPFGMNQLIGIMCVLGAIYLGTRGTKAKTMDQSAQQSNTYH
ncbi:DMT family transporter [Cytobacillus sp.]|uniref:DMT family transporter n=1 Tax=Cytobacillus sp. TaxID=2675269 RepID=UPI0028BDBDA3|nr:DMT family transporter [Cytobacillus sp.]